MAKFEPVLLANVGKPNSHTLAAYEADGRLPGAAQGAGRNDAGQTIDMVKATNLRGRGGAGFPTGLKWTFLPKDHPGPIYMCINADESEPGTFNNRILMEDDPHQVIEGIILSCYATRATTAYLYIRYEYPLGLRSAASGDRRVVRQRPAWARTSSGTISRSTSTCTAAPRPTSAAKRPD